MAEKNNTAAAIEQDGFREAVCIHTSKVFDSCKDKDCIEDLRVYPLRCSQAIIDSAFSIRPRSAKLLFADVRVEDISFNRGCYTVDVTYFYKVTGEAFPGEQIVTGLAIFDKRVILYGSEGCIKIKTIGKAKAPFCYIFVTNNASKGIQTLKQIMMYLLKPCRRANRNFIYVARLI